MFTIGVDVGGTYTDLVATDETGRTVFAKSPSTPSDQSIGVMAGLEELARRLGVTRAEMLATTDRLVHGTTVATNALLERKGAKVALLTTEGHRDVIEMREGLKPDRYDLRSPPPEPLVPRERRFGVRERLKADGSASTPLDKASLSAAIAAVKQSGATSVAVCFLHSYLNPVHELAAVERLMKELPDASVSRSSDVLPQIKEYERVSTTIVNAYVEPVVRRYLTNLERRLSEAGFKGSLFVVLSHGGMAPVEEASRLAAGTVLSGPAGGISGSRRCADLLHIPDLVPFDMGGTSTDISLIADGQASLSADGMLAGQRIALRSLDIASIAAGGGSIASVDASRTLRVGPESAGSVPGPACYGNGGTAATVTDANVVLGYLDAAAFMGGARPLDRAASEAAIDLIASALELSRLEAAAGIYKMINLKMADGIRLMTLRRGVDPRKFALLSFGGAAGLHAAEVARELEIRRIIVPTVASVLSAWGMLTSDLRYEVSRTHYGAAGAFPQAKYASCSLNWSSRRPAGFAPGSAGPLRSSAPPKCAMASRCSRSTFPLMISISGQPISSTRSKTAFTVVTRNCTPTPRPARKSCSSTRGWPRSARLRSAARAPRRRARRAPACRAASGRPISAAGARCRSTRSTISGPAIPLTAPRSSRPRPRRCWSIPAIASPSMRSAGSTSR